MANEKILVVDDDVNICELLRLYLTKEGYQVTIANDGEEGLDKFNQVKPDMVLLDVMMPKMDGLEVCRRIRQFSDIPIIFLSAKDDETDRLVGLNMGGDDYVTKPFHVKEVIARVYSLLRRTRGEVLQKTTSYTIRDLTIDKEKFTVLRGQQPIALTPTEFNLLLVLASAPDRVFSRMQLVDKVQGGYGFEGYERTIDTHIRNLRKKLEPDPAHPTYILTVYGIGYKFDGGNHEES